MITYSIIQKSQLEGTHRIDAEYYQPEYLKIGRQLTSCPSLIELSTKITDFGAYSQMNFVKFVNSGVRFFRNQDVSEFTINDADPVYVSNDTYERLSLKLEEQDIITPRVGTLGNSAIIFKKSLPATANQNLAQIKPDRTKIDPVYLSIFLCSNYGKKQFEHAATGNVQPWLNLQQIKSLKIFKPSSEFQSKVKQIALLAMEIVDKSDELYVQAQNILLQELGLTDLQIPDDLAFEVNFSDVKNASRMDADYFQPKYEVLVSKLKSQDAKPLLNVIKNIAANFNPSSKPDESFRYVELSNINASIGIIDGYSEVLGKEAPGRAKRVLNTGDVIVSSVEGSLGKVALVDEEQKGYLASTGFFQFRSDVILPEVLLVLAKSKVFRMQLEKETAGTILTAVPKDAIKNILLPVLPMRVQQKIVDLVRKSHDARKKSKALLDEAKRKVEEMIEKNDGKN